MGTTEGREKKEGVNWWVRGFDIVGPQIRVRLHQFGGVGDASGPAVVGGMDDGSCALYLLVTSVQEPLEMALLLCPSRSRYVASCGSGGTSGTLDMMSSNSLRDPFAARCAR